MRIHKMSQAESMRYAKIQRQIDLLCGKDKTILDEMAKDGMKEPFHVGKKITVNDNTIRIKNKTYAPSELKVTINTEGSMAIYDYSGKKLCGSISLNVSTKNVELFSLWARRHNVPAEVVSGKRERIFQWVVFAVAFLVIILVRFLRIYLRI